MVILLIEILDFIEFRVKYILKSHSFCHLCPLVIKLISMVSFLKDFIRSNEIKGFIFDLNGTMVNDMPYHVKSWHNILNALGKEISLEDTKKECYGKNEEVIERVLPGRYSLEERTKIGLQKEIKYREEFTSELKLLDGLQEVLTHFANDGIAMSIGSAAIMDNIDFVLDGCNVRRYFQSIISADHVEKSKPHPETFLKCADSLNIKPEQCLVFEDAPKGVECAVNAGMKTVVLTTTHPLSDFDVYRQHIIYSSDNYL